MIWFTSDLHLGHTKVIQYSNRPYGSVEEMNETLLANWNARVGPKDEVYHLGDFCFRSAAWEVADFLRRLHGRKHFGIGNHDKPKQLEALVGTELEELFHVKYLKYQGERFWLAHYAHRTWRKSNHGSYHLFGHSHGDLPPYGRSMDVGVDAQNYAPISIDEVMLKLSGSNHTHHHKERTLE